MSRQLSRLPKFYKLPNPCILPKNIYSMKSNIFSNRNVQFPKNNNLEKFYSKKFYLS